MNSHINGYTRDPTLLRLNPDLRQSHHPEGEENEHGIIQQVNDLMNKNVPYEEKTLWLPEGNEVFDGANIDKIKTKKHENIIFN